MKHNLSHNPYIFLYIILNIYKNIIGLNRISKKNYRSKIYLEL